MNTDLSIIDAGDETVKAAWNRLNKRQQRYCLELMADENQTQAYYRAGYKPRDLNAAKASASRLSTNVNLYVVLTYLRFKKSEKIQEQVDISVEGIIKDLITIKNRCLQHIEPIVQRNNKQLVIEDVYGNNANAYVFNVAGALRALELLGKHLGMFDENRKKWHDDPADTTDDEAFRAELAKSEGIIVPQFRRIPSKQSMCD